MSVPPPDAMTKYLISFPSGAMVFPDGELKAVSDAARAVVAEAKQAGVGLPAAAVQQSASIRNSAVTVLLGLSVKLPLAVPVIV